MSVNDYRSVSFWLETCGDDLTPRPALPGTVEADVAILGAGYTGLWTALYLLRRRPSLRVVVLEREIAGFGASGRNGGWCSSGFPVTPGLLMKRFGRDAARAVCEAMYEAVHEVGDACRQEGIDAEYCKGGSLRIARGAHQLPAIRHAYASYQQLGLSHRYQMLDASESRARVCASDTQGALFNADCATIHPGKLVRGLARAVERRGGTIYEQTEVLGWRTGSEPRLETSCGTVRAATVVLAGEAYLTRFPALRRQITPVYSLIALTEQLPPALWKQIGWSGRECISSNRLTVDYLIRTADDRLLFGSRGAPYHFGSRIKNSYDRHEPTYAMIRRLVLAWFPMLGDTCFTHSWGGPVGMPRDWMPSFTYEPESGLAWGRGYTGQGVATSNLAGRTLADLLLREESSVTCLPMVGHRSPDWEPEPLRWLGTRYIQYVYGRIDRRAERTGRAPTGKTPAERLGAH